MALRFHLPERWPLYLIAALIAAVTLVTVIGERGALHLWRLHGEKARLDEQNYRLQQENQAFRQRIARLRNDDFYLEKLVREELNLVRPGDVVYRFYSAEPRPTRNSPSNEPTVETPRPVEQKPRR